MEELSIYLTPIEAPGSSSPKGNSRLDGKVQVHTKEGGFPFIDQNVDIALIGVKEGRRSLANEECSEGPESVREYFYSFFDHFGGERIADLGNIEPGSSVEDTDHALANSIQILLNKEILPIIIGGGHELTYAQFRGYEKIGRTINLGVVDPRIDLGDPSEPLSSSSFLGHLLTHRPNYLFNYAHIGYQTFFNDPEVLQVMEKMHFDVERVGKVQEDVKEMEPLIRDMDLLSFDIGAVRGSEAPGNIAAGPNGLFGDEACQLCRYAGMNDKMTSIGFYELNPNEDERGMTAHLVAQMIWYFIEGFHNRKRDLPILHRKEFFKYIVDLKEAEYKLIFYKSKKSGRWWLEVPYPPDDRFEHERSHLVPCSYSDYLEATNDEIPDKWLKTYSKLG